VNIQRGINRVILFCLITLLVGGWIPYASAQGMDIEIENYDSSMEVINPGDEFTLNINICNNAGQDINDLMVQIERASGFSAGESNAPIPISDTLLEGESMTVPIQMFYNSGGEGQIPLIFTYFKAGEAEQLKEEQYLIVKIAEDSGELQKTGNKVPVLRIEDKETLQTGAGNKIETRLKIKNVSPYSAREVLIKATFEDEEVPFSFSGEQTYYYRSISSQSTKPIVLGIDTAASAENGTYLIKIEYQFTNSSGDVYTSFENVCIEVSGDVSPPDLIFSPKLDEEQQLLPGEEFNLSITVNNQGDLTARDIAVDLEGLSDEGINLVSGSARRYMEELEAGTEQNITYTIIPAPQLEDGSYPLNLKISYIDENGVEYSDQQEIFLPVSKEGVVGEDDPSIILKHYEASPLQVVIGEEFILYMDFFNTHCTRTLRNIKVELNINTSLDEKDSVFTTVDAGNTFYIDEIQPEQIEQRSLHLNTISDVEAGLYYIICSMEYEDEAGEKYKNSQLMRITVKQLTRFEVGDIRMAGDMQIGKPIYVYCTFYNTGSTTLRNMLIKMNGDFEVEDGAIYVGNMEQNTSDYFRGTVKPLKEGDLAGNIVFSYEDTSSGEPVVVRKAFTINIAGEKTETIPDGQNTPHGPLNLWYMIGPVVLAGAVPVYLISRRRRKDGEEMEAADEN